MMKGLVVSKVMDSYDEMSVPNFAKALAERRVSERESTDGGNKQDDTTCGFLMHEALHRPGNLVDGRLFLP